MPRYAVVIIGQNFRLKFDGVWNKYGFFTTRFLDAPDPLLAEVTALENFRHSPKGQQVFESSLNSDNDPPILAVEKVREVPPGTSSGEPEHGLAFYEHSLDTGADETKA